MDFHLKQWRDQQHESDSVKLPRLHLQHNQHQPSPDNSSSSPALPLFSPEPTPTKLSAAFPLDSSSIKMGGGYFSMGQWQELELQTLIFRHMLTGTAIPPELLHLLLKKRLINSPSPSSYFQFSHPLQHFPHFQPALMQSGYWGRGAMDPEPGRCRRTDGKKWRCSRDIVVGHKYCERHVHRGRNRSRKPVEIPTPTTTKNINPMTGRGGGGGGGEALKTANAARSSTGGSDNPFSALAGGGGNNFSLSGHSPSFDLLHLNQRTFDIMIENKNIFRSENEDNKSDGRILRPFFDDWPRSIHEPDNASGDASSLTTSTSLSISVPGNPSSDFSLKLSTGDVEEEPGVQERERPLLNWGMAWGSNPVGSMGGPLAEALRSSARSSSNSSPTSVLH